MHTPTKKNVEIFLAKRCTNCIDYTLFRYPKIHLFFPLCLSENKKNRVLLIRWFARNFNSSRSRIIKTYNASLWFIIIYNFYYSRYALHISSTNIGLKIIIVFRLAVVYNTNKIIFSSLNFNFVGIVTIYLSFSLFLSFFFIS